jgi:hypothetical protein
MRVGEKILLFFRKTITIERKKMKTLIVGFTLLTLIGCNNSEDVLTDDSIAEESSCSDPRIKGNLTTYNGEQIYHVPGGQYYEITDAEEMFCTEEEAEEAGYRRSKR